MENGSGGVGGERIDIAAGFNVTDNGVEEEEGVVGRRRLSSVCWKLAAIGQRRPHGAAEKAELILAEALEFCCVH